MIEIKDIKKSFGLQQVLKGITFSISAGETISIVGPSGTGKSVLLKLITSLMLPDSGDVVVNGKSLNSCKNERERRAVTKEMGVLFQSAALFDSLTVFENVAFPLRLAKHSSKEDTDERVIARLEEVGMLDYAYSYPGEISIGMRKRVGIARALVSEPRIILFDEPNTGLDPLMGQEIYDLIRKTQAERDFTGIVISHEIPEVFQVCKRVVMLFQGRVQADLGVEEFLNSDCPVVRQFVNGSPEGPIQISA